MVSEIVYSVLSDNINCCVIIIEEIVMKIVIIFMVK